MDFFHDVFSAENFVIISQTGKSSYFFQSGNGFFFYDEDTWSILIVEGLHRNFIPGNLPAENGHGWKFWLFEKWNGYQWNIVNVCISELRYITELRQTSCRGFMI